MSGGAPTGNNNAGKGKEWAAALRAAMAHRDQDGDYRKTLLAIADGVVQKGLDGDVTAVTEIANRMDGKPHQSTDVALSGDVNVNRTMYGGKVEP